MSVGVGAQRCAEGAAHSAKGREPHQLPQPTPPLQTQLQLEALTFMPRSRAMNSAPVTMAMSCSRALRRSPKPGACMHERVCV